MTKANYLSLDSPDIQFETRPLCKRVSKPTQGDVEFVRRLGRYLRSHPGAVWSFPWQRDVSKVTARLHFDWAGDRRDRQWRNVGTGVTPDQRVVKGSGWSASEEQWRSRTVRRKKSDIRRFGTGVARARLGNFAGLTLELDDNTAEIGTMPPTWENIRRLCMSARVFIELKERWSRELCSCFFIMFQYSFEPRQLVSHLSRNDVAKDILNMRCGRF